MRAQILIIAIAIVITGCTGKKQTNPLPDDNQKVIPQRDIVLPEKVDNKYILDLDAFAATNMKRKNIAEADNKTLWDIGMERGHK